MEERISKKEMKELSFEESGQIIRIVVEFDNLFREDVPKTKDFLESMFKEILSTIY